MPGSGRVACSGDFRWPEAKSGAGLAGAGNINFNFVRYAIQFAAEITPFSLLRTARYGNLNLCV